MRDSVPSARYSSVYNVLCLWRISLIPTYRVYRLYDIYIYLVGYMCTSEIYLIFLLCMLSAVISFTHLKSYKTILYLTCDIVVITVPSTVWYGRVVHCSYGNFNHAELYCTILGSVLHVV